MSVITPYYKDLKPSTSTASLITLISSRMKAAKRLLPTTGPLGFFRSLCGEWDLPSLIR